MRNLSKDSTDIQKVTKFCLLKNNCHPPLYTSSCVTPNPGSPLQSSSSAVLL